MLKARSIFFGLIFFWLTACGVEPTPVAIYSPYYFVAVPANATPTPTPFQPSAPLPEIASRVVFPTQLPIEPSATWLPPLATVEPLPTATTQPLDQPAQAVITTPQPVIAAPEALTFLLLGSDLRPGSSYRTDTLVVAILRPRDGQVALISIPRDLWVNIPQVGMQRINTAYQSGEILGYPGGGPGLLKDTLLFNLGLSIDYTAMVDFDGFRRIVDTLGGIEVPVACPYTDWRLLDPTYDPENEDNWNLFTAGPGLIRMDGDYALWYARSRKKSNDFDRGRRQQEVLRAIYAQALRTDTLGRLPQLYSDFSSTIQTDLGIGDLLELAPLSLHLTNADIRSYYIAGDLVTSWITPGGAYVLLPNTDLIQAMLNEAVSPSPRQQERRAVRIEIQNGSVMDGWEMLAAQRLNYAGYETTLAPADNRDHSQTLLYDLTPEQDYNRSASLLAVLGLPQTALVSAPSSASQTAYALLLGSDYNPCFDPQTLTP